MARRALYIFGTSLHTPHASVGVRPKPRFESAPAHPQAVGPTAAAARRRSRIASRSAYSFQFKLRGGHFMCAIGRGLGRLIEHCLKSQSHSHAKGRIVMASRC